MSSHILYMFISYRILVGMSSRVRRPARLLEHLLLLRRCGLHAARGGLLRQLRTRPPDAGCSYDACSWEMTRLHMIERHVCVHIYVYIYIYIYIYIERERETYAYMYVCMCIYIYIYIYTHMVYNILLSCSCSINARVTLYASSFLALQFQDNPQMVANIMSLIWFIMLESSPPKSRILVGRLAVYIYIYREREREI